MILASTIDPCQQIRQAIIAHLRGLCGGFARPIPQTQIRGILDLSGEPKDSAGIIVSCDHLGQHGGGDQKGRLIDVSPRIVVFSHLNDDSDGSICNALVNDVLVAMQSMTYTLTGWLVKWGGNWTFSDVRMDSSYRQVELAATLPLVKYN